jgi:sec-independent protein translocase protein TatA
MNLGPAELLILFAIVVLIFGSAQLPKLARSIGQAQNELRKGLSDGSKDDGA